MDRDRTCSPALRRAGFAIGAILLAAAPAMVGAQATAADGAQTYSLTQQQKADILARGSESRVDDSLLRAQSG
jgi:hypothetical protein